MSLVSQAVSPTRETVSKHLLPHTYERCLIVCEVEPNAARVEIVKLGRRLNVRQQALATAQVYVRRYYTKVEIRTTNPYLVLATAFYLACKMEECPQHIRLVVGEARNTWPGKNVTCSGGVAFC